MKFETFYAEFNIQVVSTSLESLEAANIFLFPEEEIQLERFQNDKRKKEFLGARKLRNQLLINSSIGYDQNGKPYLTRMGQTSISISHTKDLVTIGIAPFAIGIDVETVQDRIRKVIDKFATEHEKNLYTLGYFNLTEWYTFIWCAKEAIYKLGQVKGLSFKDEILIEQIVLAENDFLQLNAAIQTKKNQERTIAVYCIKQENYLFAVAKIKD